MARNDSQDFETGNINGENSTFSWNNQYNTNTLDDFTFSSVNTTSTAVFQDYPTGLLNFGATCCIIFAIIGVPGNIISVIALVRCPRLKNNATTWFIVNLCIADALICAFSNPLSVSTLIQRTWAHGDKLCEVFPIIRFTNVGVSLLSVVAITVNRYILMVHPSHYKIIYRKRTIAVMMFLIWIISFLFVLPPLLKVWGKFGFDPSAGSCTILKLNNRSPKVFIYVFAFVLPSFAFIICYSRIYWVVRKAHKNVQEQLKVSSERQYEFNGKEPPKSPRLTTLNNLRGKLHLTSASNNRKRKQLSRDIKLLRMILVLFCTFIVCYLPMTIVKVSRKESDFPVTNILGYVSFYFSSCVNPIIYVIMSQEYRKAYKNLFTCSKDATTSSTS
ncbi:G-protein coupled receptor moody-like [Limulus polyphemus]|uniref:G-protein coupled receptor moody-like n=1 Tax=Limulus polyphemus TaxID=6850 RepID=A0ABM1BFE3_LIMPO|nr:G-protein coupled receptor moody-like [Limulus polyphemus]